MQVLVVLALVAAASARPQIFPFTSPVLPVKPADSTVFPVAQTYTAAYPNPNPINYATFPNTYSTFPNTYSTFPNTYSTFPNTYGAFSAAGYAPFAPQYINPVVTATNFKAVEAKRTKRSADPEAQQILPSTTAIHYAGNPTVIPNVFPSTFSNFQTFQPSPYTFPNYYNPSATHYSFPAGVANPSFINPYTFAYPSVIGVKKDD
ncbi:hypothetical protein Pmani_021488 [Petrolisthes manimaculis]|uniref:Uncharacterized protein n=1 Tax=Petrolisthes manimaculis TaxID=1843537 RepID=A0AAE1U243_9EUCA|nr:hypothetical protein Pmani_021488 [Petrolisthes manimaculis]